MTELLAPSNEAFDGEPCAMPAEYAIRALMVEQDMERARLRGRIMELEKIIEECGLTPLADDGSSMREAYYLHYRAAAAVMEHFGCDGFTLGTLPAELHAAFRPLLVT